MPTYLICDDDGDTTIEAADMSEAVQYLKKWLREGWDCMVDGTTVFATGHAIEILPNGEHGKEETRRVTLDPPEPKCCDDGPHDWRSEVEIVGGIKDNPGVIGHGGGVIYREACHRCGCGKTTDTWAQDPYDGTQGLTSISYAPDMFSQQLFCTNEETE